MALIDVNAARPVRPPLVDAAEEGNGVAEARGVLGGKPLEVIERDERPSPASLLNGNHLRNRRTIGLFFAHR